MITSRRWRKLRAEVIGNKPLCQRCQQHDRITAATELHHIMPVEPALGVADMERLMFSPSNLIPLCHDCHVELHRELFKNSRQSNRQRTDAKLAAIRARYM